MSKEKEVKPLPPPEPQICPKCKKEYHDNKWGGCGKCECGYYFHPEWYSKKNDLIDTLKETAEKYGGKDVEVTIEPYLPDPNLTEEEIIEQARKYGKIK